MIESILDFCLRSTVCSAVFAAYYLVALKNARMHSFNRIYLLGAVFLSLCLPLADLEMPGVGHAAIPALPLLPISGKGAGEGFTTTAATHAFNWKVVLAAGYFGVALAMVLRLAIKSFSIYKLKRKGQQIRGEGFLIIKTDDPRAPFSFMDMLFWPIHMRQDSPEGKGILMHEQAHIMQHHTVDKLFMQLMLAACWLNPFNWLIKNELWLQHEFLADSYAIKDRDGDTFARMLLHGVAHSLDSSIINPFFQSPVKRRLQMLTRPGRNAYVFLRCFLSIPVMLTAALLLSAKTEPLTGIIRSPKKIVMVLDPAHGGHDGGGKSIYGDQEKDITLAICKSLGALAREYNIEVITTRDGDVDASLEERLNKSNSTDAALFLSIHVNKSTKDDERSNGYELGLSPQSGNYRRSLLLASAIAGGLKNQKLPVKLVDDSNAYVIRGNTHPALIIECGSLDDVGNMALLKDNRRRELLCRNILSGIVNYNIRLNGQ